MKTVQVNMNRRATLQLRAGFQHKEYIIRIRYIGDETIEVLSPMEKSKPIPIPYGRQVIIQEEPVGGTQNSHTSFVLDQYWDESEDEWILVLAQPPDSPLVPHQLFREEIELPFNVTIPGDPEQSFEAISINLSGSGVLLTMDLQDRSLFQQGDSVGLQFALHIDDVNVPFTFTGKVVRLWESQVLAQPKLMLGIAFDKESMAEEDQDLLMAYLVKKQIVHHADRGDLSSPSV